MKLNITDFHKAMTLIEESGCPEAAIAAQFALDLAVTSRFGTIEPAQARKLLHDRIVRHRATLHPVSGTVH